MSSVVTLADVAAAAGVNASTVSRTLSRPELVSPATYDKVARAVDQLGYVPNRAARQLAGGRTAAVAMLVPDVTNPFFAGVVRAAQRVASENGQVALLADTGGRGDAELVALRSIAASVDGVICCSPTASTGDLRAAADGRPMVFVNRRGRGVASVATDQAAIVAHAAEHVTTLGHRRIVALAGPSSYWSSSQRKSALERLDATDDASIDLIEGCPPTFEGGRASFGTIMDLGATAVLAFNDLMALGVIAAAAEHGRSVPRDLSVVGSDDVPYSSMSTPSLTTVAAPVSDLGAVALDSLNAMLAGDPPQHEQLQPWLVARQSTAAAPPANELPPHSNTRGDH